jgi:hypothetical protein
MSVSKIRSQSNFKTSGRSEQNPHLICHSWSIILDIFIIEKNSSSSKLGSKATRSASSTHALNQAWYGVWGPETNKYTKLLKKKNKQILPDENDQINIFQVYSHQEFVSTYVQLDFPLPEKSILL